MVKVTRSVFTVLYVQFFLFIAERLSARLLVLECVFSVGGGVVSRFRNLSRFRNAVKGVACAQTSVPFRNAIKIPKVVYY